LAGTSTPPMLDGAVVLKRGCGPCLAAVRAPHRAGVQRDGEGRGRRRPAVYATVARRPTGLYNITWWPPASPPVALPSSSPSRDEQSSPSYDAMSSHITAHLKPRDASGVSSAGVRWSRDRLRSMQLSPGGPPGSTTQAGRGPLAWPAMETAAADRLMMPMDQVAAGSAASVALLPQAAQASFSRITSIGGINAPGITGIDAQHHKHHRRHRHHQGGIVP
jgi:hypothetical protein